MISNANKQTSEMCLICNERVYLSVVLTHPLDPNCDRIKAIDTKVAGPKHNIPFAL